MNVPGWAMSSSVCLSYPRWMASSGRWNSRRSQLATTLRDRPDAVASACGTLPPGTTVDAVMSSSDWTLTAAEKSGRSENSRHEPSASNPTRR